MTSRKHSHYFLDVKHLEYVDVYRLCDLAKMGDDSGAKHHALKKILFSGKRGAKNEAADIQEAIDTLQRKLEMMAEDVQLAKPSPELPPAPPVREGDSKPRPPAKPVIRPADVGGYGEGDM